MNKLSDIINPLKSLKEKTRLEDDKKILDDAIETITWLSITIKNQKDKIINCEQQIWERNVAINQLKELGYELGETVIFSAYDVPKRTGNYIGKIKHNEKVIMTIVNYDGINWYYGDTPLVPGVTLLEYRKLPIG